MISCATARTQYYILGNCPRTNAYLSWQCLTRNVICSAIAQETKFTSYAIIMIRTMPKNKMFMSEVIAQEKI